ncbi:MAG: alanine--tRNA ligase [Bacteroidota bacterium]
MTSSEIRNSFLKFFEERAHTIVPSAPVVPYDDPTLLFANAGMNQFKDVFLGTGKRSYTRATDTQKCIRVSGKHNDLEEVGRDTYHHTFFEMLGNWSFGDYYKKEAIEWAWELLTKVWGLPKNRLWATVYKDDQEAEQLWKSATDIDPNHILRFGEKDNFWEMGETGPCGPCSEIHIDRTLDGTATASMVNAGVADVMEIWNLVFIQYNRDESGKLTPLPAKHVDTGMGFERVCAVLQNKNSNYDSDVFHPIIHKISKITGQPYNGSLQSTIGNRQSEIDTSIRVIADHVRTLTFAIGDGAIPSNEGRGYVLRRILRRAARFGRNLGMHEPFIYQLVPTLVETMSYIFPEIKTNQDHIQRVIKGEEESFNATLDRGIKLFENEAFANALILSARNEGIETILESRFFQGDIVPSEIEYSEISFFRNGNLIAESRLEELLDGAWRKILKNPPMITGKDAFKLYDTFGFPLDLTELMAIERGLKVDTTGFSELMKNQKNRSRETAKNVNVPGILKFWAGDAKQTQFVGYTEFECDASITSLAEGFVVLDKTPFYAESGGQVGDTGVLIGKDATLHISNTQRDGNVIGHKVDEEVGDLFFEQRVHAKVDIPRRLSIMRNHSATHLLHKALRQILGTHVQQAGSLVAPEYFRFDFSHFAKLSDQELTDIEALVNEKIKENIPRTPGLNNILFEDAKKMGALMFFGDKYGERVNVIQFGDFSTEFCGGTHVNNTGEIGYFKICEESSIASGVRRIVAVTGTYAVGYLIEQEREFEAEYNFAYNRLEEIFKSQIEDIKELPTIPNQASPELTGYFAQLHKNKIILKNVIEQDNEEKKKLEKERAKSRIKSLSGSMDELISSAVSVDNIKLIAVKVSAASMDELKSLGDSLRAKLGSGVGLLASIIEDKVQLVCVVTDDLVATKKIEAGKIVGAVAKIVGGGGGGRPHMATAGGKDIAKIDEALSHTKSIVESLLKK